VAITNLRSQPLRPIRVPSTEMKILPSDASTGCFDDVDGYSLIIPALSVGNVGQLAVDVLLATLKPERVGALSHPALLPVVGSDPLVEDSDQLMTACEVFKCEESKLLFLQLRSSVIKTKKEQFIDDLLQWATELKISQLIVLASFAADERTDSQIVGIPIRYLSNVLAKKEELKVLKCQELEQKNTFPSLPPATPNAPGEVDSLYIPGGGFAKTLYNKSLNSKLAVVELLTFASEGDNTGDAIRMVAFVDEWLKVVPKINGRPAVKFPISWGNLFGNAAPGAIY